MNRFRAKNHCSLTSVSAIFNYYRQNGYYKIDQDVDKIFQRVRKFGEDNLYYMKDYGTFPVFIDRLATRIWKSYGYPEGKGKNKFFYWDFQSLIRTIREEIDQKRPGIISFSSGYYWNHSVTFYGYLIFKNNLGDEKVYLLINDNWTEEERYVDTTYLGSLGCTIFEICKIIPEPL